MRSCYDYSNLEPRNTSNPSQTEVMYHVITHDLASRPSLTHSAPPLSPNTAIGPQFTHQIYLLNRRNPTRTQTQISVTKKSPPRPHALICGNRTTLAGPMTRKDAPLYVFRKEDTVPGSRGGFGLHVCMSGWMSGGLAGWVVPCFIHCPVLL